MAQQKIPWYLLATIAYKQNYRNTVGSSEDFYTKEKALKKLLQLTRIRTSSYQNTGTRSSPWEVAVAWLPAAELQHSHQLRSQPTPRADWLREPAYRHQRQKTIVQRQVIWHWSFCSHTAQRLTHNSFSLLWVEMRRKGQVVLLFFLRIAIL